MVGIGEPVDDAEVVAVGLLDRAVSAPSPVQMFASSAFWRMNSARSPAPTQHVSLTPSIGCSSAGLSANASASSSFRSSVQGKPHHRPEIMNA